MQYIDTKIEEKAYNMMFNRTVYNLNAYLKDYDYLGENKQSKFVARKVLDKFFDVVADYAKYEYDPDATDL